MDEQVFIKPLLSSQCVDTQTGRWNSKLNSAILIGEGHARGTYPFTCAPYNIQQHNSRTAMNADCGPVTLIAEQMVVRLGWVVECG